MNFSKINKEICLYLSLPDVLTSMIIEYNEIMCKICKTTSTSKSKNKDNYFFMENKCVKHVGEYICEDCEKLCQYCGKTTCNMCDYICNQCKSIYCRGCKNEVEKCGWCGDNLCKSCPEIKLICIKCNYDHHIVFCRKCRKHAQKFTCWICR